MLDSSFLVAATKMSTTLSKPKQAYRNSNDLLSPLVKPARIPHNTLVCPAIPAKHDMNIMNTLVGLKRDAGLPVNRASPLHMPYT